MAASEVVGRNRRHIGAPGGAWLYLQLGVSMCCRRVSGLAAVMIADENQTQAELGQRSETVF
jgi:hypothetical protein